MMIKLEGKRQISPSMACLASCDKLRKRMSTRWLSIVDDEDSF